jgi:hypothetical protein
MNLLYALHRELTRWSRVYFALEKPRRVPLVLLLFVRFLLDCHGSIATQIASYRSRTKLPLKPDVRGARATTFTINNEARDDLRKFIERCWRRYDENKVHGSRHGKTG